jgi:hypothetical protein
MTAGKEVPMGFTGETYPPGIHMCYIYKDEEERKRIIFKFLESGLLNGEKVSYFMDTNTSDEMKEHQAALGVDRLYEKHQGHLLLATMNEICCPTGTFVPDDMLYRLSEFYAQSIDEGYTGARSSGEMSWATRGIPGSSLFMDYEARINDTLRHYPITAICQYNVRCFDNKTLRTYWPSIP